MVKKNAAKEGNGDKPLKGPTWSASGARLSTQQNGQDFGVPLKTGRVIASMPGHAPEVMQSAFKKLQTKCGLKDVCHSSDFEGAMEVNQGDQSEVIFFDEFRIAVLSADPDQRASMVATASDYGFQLEEERWNYPQNMDEDLEPGPTNPDFEFRAPQAHSIEYLKGFRDGLSKAIVHLEAKELDARVEAEMSTVTHFFDTPGATWGLQATGTLSTLRSGFGSKIAILDTGVDVTHPDFLGRGIVTKSFIPAQVLDRFNRPIVLTDTDARVDRSGHGTHCLGTACGVKQPQSGRRYGVAPGAEAFSGKVLSVIPGQSRASGADAWIIEGLSWAISQGCNIISLSLGSRTAFGEGHSPAYESIASDALRNGILIMAAAGNDSIRNGSPPVIVPVSSPANCPSIIAVAAIGSRLNSGGIHALAYFSNRHINNEGGELNFCAPGIGVESSYTSPRIQSLDGTSQATPHVAGIAALVREGTNLDGLSLYQEMRRRVKVQGSRLDYGVGLVHF